MWRYFFGVLGGEDTCEEFSKSSNFWKTTENMDVLKASYLLLYSIIGNNFLYVHIPSTVGEAGLCYDEKRYITMKKILVNDGI